MGRVIINADDFGISKEINKAIISAFEQTLITSTSMMTNMPGFSDACKLVHTHNLYEKVGIHLNLTSGYPITSQMSLNRRFCDENGKFKDVRERCFKLNKAEREVLELEFQAQINRLKNQNINPTHIDSHHHYHTDWAISNQVVKIARRNKIKAIRLSRNCGNDNNIIKMAYKFLYNSRLGLYQLAKVDYFGSITDTTTVKNLASCNIEIMVHPGFDIGGNLIDLTIGEELKPLFERIKKLTPNGSFSSYYDTL